jgi:hypothetical protein
MKHSLGKRVIFLLSAVILHAEDFEYSLSVNKTNPYLKEGVGLVFDLEQTNHRKRLLVDFDLKADPCYVFERINIDQSDRIHYVKKHYTYLVFPLCSGDLNVRFTLQKSVTGDESLDYRFSGGSDIVMQRIAVKSTLFIPPLTLKVKPLPKDVALVGDFNLTYAFKTHHANTHEPLAYRVHIEGFGYPPILDTLLPQEGNFTRFSESPTVISKSDVNGTYSTVTYPMALSHDKDFTLPAVRLKAFNPQTEKTYELTIPTQTFSITQPDIATLVDTTDAPKALKVDWSWLGALFSYLIVFVVGYLSASLPKWKRNPLSKKSHPLKNKIQNCHDAKTLLQILMAADNKNLSYIIQKLEASLYGNGKITLKEIKKEILEIL